MSGTISRPSCSSTPPKLRFFKNKCRNVFRIGTYLRLKMNIRIREHVGVFQWTYGKRKNGKYGGKNVSDTPNSARAQIPLSENPFILNSAGRLKWDFKSKKWQGTNSSGPPKLQQLSAKRVCVCRILVPTVESLVYLISTEWRSAALCQWLSPLAVLQRWGKIKSCSFLVIIWDYSTQPFGVRVQWDFHCLCHGFQKWNPLLGDHVLEKHFTSLQVQYTR